MSQNCKNCGGCEKCEPCDHCGQCRKCGKVICRPYTYYYHQPYYVPYMPVYTQPYYPTWTINGGCGGETLTSDPCGLSDVTNTSGNLPGGSNLA